ncbi:MAG: UDP-4-amino-4,6-dideoxy-N-acetyl-beta-L-altrosamine transaminase [Nanoarchaeota archaeon]|nr:UDP-4-amino-4,6-dideoxy-N-acetyl-beta-L-altrosamine transaminase [Nanoarchaeota archaeon]MBU1321075.1 UDP-4-amino-4,6-dideoxy-N-acetyl-beta-L-altrosamine transaminase [Nanoarchaeota archaeon]MBU1597080.1 UDP-4-amino-4,6-dideoxy-N-acetyl-beta-L-altrosamine transaminase [Nanoarchaeota archaeon]MBU2440870.1 UDP-4-amino-4,6-dideoxy-N-acetyl-beta-L-altrosamine transaminase [Nanoarchaeota archaeon]
MKSKLKSYGRQSIDEEDIKAVSDVLRSDFLTTGPKVAEFEQKFANYVRSKYAVAVSSGTAALHVACLAAGLKENDELITTPMTFAASANCALYCGAKPVFVDIHPETGLIDETKIENKITKQTKIIIPVHYSGLSCEMEKIRKIAKKHRLIIIEDACHALGAKYKKSKIGDCRYSDMAVFSFHPVKHITTGEGGMITTNSKELYEKLKVFRNHGIVREPKKLISRNEGPWYYEMQELGFNYRITDFQCALGLSQLKKVDGFINKRREIAKRYNDAFGNQQDLEIIREKEEQFNSYHLYIIKTSSRKNRLLLFERLKEKGISCQVHYIPVYWHPHYQKLGYKKGACPNAENFYNQIISIPMYPTLNRKEQEFVIKTIKKSIKEAEESR